MTGGYEIDMNVDIISKWMIESEMNNAPIPDEMIEMVNKKIVEAASDGKTSVLVNFESTKRKRLVLYSLACQLEIAGYTVTKMFGDSSLGALLIEW